MRNPAVFPRLPAPSSRALPRRVGLILLLLVGGAGLWALPAAPARQPTPDRPRTEEERQRALTLLKPGQDPDDVRQLLGAPRRTCRQILYHRYLEQWVYEGPYYVRVEFDCLRGQRPRLAAYVPASPEKR